jgi:peptidoglycan/xylan/chitin deacetylase (PgdA/CDA1 family)
MHFCRISGKEVPGKGAARGTHLASTLTIVTVTPHRRLRRAPHVRLDPASQACGGRGLSFFHPSRVLVALLAAITLTASAPGHLGAVLAARDQRVGGGARSTPCQVSILAYHRFGPTVADSMTVRTTTFRSHLEYLATHQHPVIPLRSLISYLQTGAPRPPAGAVVITIDDGHQSVMRDALPLVREFNVPVTLFIYPSAISNASYAMTWTDLQALTRTGRFDVQSHTYWHPNFRNEKRRLAPAAYQAFAVKQLSQSRTVLQRRLGTTPDLVAWPFGVYNDEAIAIARDSGYVAGFGLGQRCVTGGDDIMALPRFLVTEVTRPAFVSMLPREAR